MVNFDEALLLL